RHPAFLDELTRHREQAGHHPLRTFPDLDLALEWCEQGLLDKYGELESDPELSLAQHGATLGMSIDQIELLSSHLEHVEYEAGEMIYGNELAVPDQMLLVTAGKISLLAEDDDGGHRRLATLSPGMTLGEISMIAGAPLAGMPRADTEVKAWVLGEGDLEVLRARNPDLVVTLLENLLRQVALRVGHMRAELLR
ncbi:MAG: cyclic nucleotide-binding domain-containing protein, partial [Solirubrobacterales bacterium]|nr:cyclic nucleotide-binding domain-containing protein [Solirubrobacterales bacterium]